MTKKWRKLIPILCAQFIGLIGLGTSTFAWFLAQTASFSALSSENSITASGEEYGFSVTDGQQPWVTGSAITVREGTDKKLAPIAHDAIDSSVLLSRASNPSNWYYKYAASAGSSESSDDPVYLTDSFDGYVYAQDFYFKANDSIDGIMVDSVTLPDSKNDLGICVLFEGTDSYIEYKQTTPQGLAKKVNLVPGVGQVEPSEEYPYGQYKLTAYIYIDGNNPYVKTNNASEIEGQISFGFSIYSEPEKVYLQSKDNSFGLDGALMYMYAWKSDGTSASYTHVYENATFPGVQMTLAKASYYDPDEEQNVTIYSAPVIADGYDSFVFSRVNPSHGTLTPTSTDIWNQTVDIEMDGTFVNKTAVLTNSVNTTIPKDARGQYRYDFIRWDAYPTHIVTFKKYASDTEPYAVVTVPDGQAILTEKIPENPSKRLCTFNGWALSTTPSIVVDLTKHKFTADATLVAVFSAPIETYTVYFQAKQFWKHSGDYYTAVHTWNSSGDIDVYPGFMMTYVRYSSIEDANYYSVEIPVTATYLQFVRVNSDGTVPSAGQRYRTDTIAISQATCANKCYWTYDTPAGTYDYYGSTENYYNGGWMNYGAVTVQLKDGDNVLKTWHVASGSTIPSFDTPLKENYIVDKYTVGGTTINVSTQTFSSDTVIDVNWKSNTRKLYFEVPNWWENDGYYPYVHVYDSPNFTKAWPGVKCSWVADSGDKKIYEATFDLTYGTLILARAKADGSKERQSNAQDLSTIGSNNCFYYNDDGQGWYKR